MYPLDCRSSSDQGPYLKQRKRFSWVLLFLSLCLAGLLAWRFNAMQQHEKFLTKLANKQHERADLIIHSMGVAVIMCGEDGKVTVFNPAAEAMFGYTSDEIVGHQLDKIIGEDYHQKHDAAYAVMVAKLKADPRPWVSIGQEITGSGRRKDGTLIKVVIRLRSIKYQDTVEFIGVLTRAPDTPAPVVEAPVKPFEARKQ